MNKLITSLVCCTVLSMSLMGAGYASNASATVGLGGTTTQERVGTTDGRMTGTMNRNDSIMNDRVRTGNNNTVAPLTNTNRNGNYRATATNATRDDNDMDWGWLGLLGLLGLAGMRSRTREHR